MNAASVVQTLARKFIGSGGPVNAPYLALAQQDLIGNTVPQTGQIIPDNWTQAGNGVLIDLSPLNEAILRWSSGQISESEADLSRMWRTTTRSIGFTPLEESLDRKRIIVPRPADAGSIVAVADDLLGRLALQDLWVEWAIEQFFLAPGRDFPRRVWRRSGHAFLQDFAPYAHHCLRSLLSLVVAARHGFLSKDPTHLIDLQYLYYSPFCHALISDDRVHRMLAPKLLRPDQSFVRGSELKRDLRLLADERDALSPEARRRRDWALGSYPPPSATALHALYGKHMLPWLGDRPTGNMIIGLSEEEAALAMAEARVLMGR